MDCKKCSGLMSYEGFYGAESGAVWYYPGWRCVHCGDVVDNVISLNRRLNCESHGAQNGHGNKNEHAHGHYHGNSQGRKNGKINGFIMKKTAAVHDDQMENDEDYAHSL